MPDQLEALVASSVAARGGAREDCYSQSDPGSPADNENVVLDWIRSTIDVIGQAIPDDRPIASLLLGVESIAVFDVVANLREGHGYLVDLPAPEGISMEAAIAGAAEEVLSVTYPQLAASLNSELRDSLADIHDGHAAEKAGVKYGREIADKILEQRSADLQPSTVQDYGEHEPGVWRTTEPRYLPAVEPDFGDVKPFALTSPSEFRPGPPPALDSAEYAAAVNQVKSIGAADSAVRTQDETDAAIFWSNDFGSITPAGHLDQIAATVASHEGLGVEQSALLFAELNVAQADSIISCWDAKFTYDFWRPITAIQEANHDGNPDTKVDPDWQPLLETPSFPEYPSGHAVIGEASAQVLQTFFGADYSFSATSPYLPGEVRHFDSFQEMAQEDALSRIYGGVHFDFSAQVGMAMGDQVAQATVNAFQDFQQLMA